MSAAAWGHRYAGGFGFEIFLRPEGRWIGHGWKDATNDPDKIAEMFRRHANALIAAVTGRRIVVLDIDRKNGKDGFHTLEAWGKSVLPSTPMAHTPNGGVHVYFARNPAVDIGTVINWPYGPVDERKLTEAEKQKKLTGLDVLGVGGSVALPTPGYGYRWDDHLNLKTVPLAIAPAWLAVKKRSSSSTKEDWQLAGTRLLAEACSRIREAGPGTRHAVAVREAFIIGCVVARGRLDEATARHELQAAAAGMVWDKSYTQRQAARDIDESFKAGLRKGGSR